MQATTGLHHLIPAVLAPQAEFVFDDPTAFDTANHMLNPHANTRNPTVLRFLIRRQGATARLFLGLRDRDPGDRKALKAQVLIQDRVGWQAIVLLVGHRFIVPHTFVGHAEKAHAAIVRNQQQIFERMLFLFPTVMEALFIHIDWSVDRAFRPIMKKRVSRPVQDWHHRQHCE